VVLMKRQIAVAVVAAGIISGCNGFVGEVKVSSQSRAKPAPQQNQNQQQSKGTPGGNAGRSQSR
jgi:hypothetical protein